MAGLSVGIPRDSMCITGASCYATVGSSGLLPWGDNGAGELEGPGPEADDPPDTAGCKQNAQFTVNSTVSAKQMTPP